MAAVWLGGCGGGPLEATWIGDLVCGQLEYEWEMTLMKDAGKVYVGDGEQSRVYVNFDQEETSEKILFDVTLEMDQGGAQDLGTTLVCTQEDTVTIPANGGEPVLVDEGCQVRRFDTFVMSWDGADVITISDGDQCYGELLRR